MKIGMNLLLWTAKVTEQDTPLLNRLKNIGYDGVEIPIFEGSPAEYKILGKTLSNLGLGATAVTVMDSSANPISPDKALRNAAVDRLKWVIDRCADSGAEVLCGPLHSPLGVFSGTAPTQDERSWGTETFLTVASYAETAKVELAVEYLNRFENYFLTTARDTLAWVDTVNHPACGMMWDTFHAHIEEKEISPCIESIRPRLKHVHISENDRGTPGTGQVHWDEHFRTLRKIGYDRWLTIEAFGRALPELAAATRVWRDLFDDADSLSRDGLAFIREQWNLAAPKEGF
jgi:D-psicose/D-tagatose/L-ribulose 3-epimerase